MTGRVGCPSLPRRWTKVTEHLLLQLRRTGHVWAPRCPKKSRLFFNNGGGRGYGFRSGSRDLYVGVSENSGFSSKSSILIGPVFHYFHPPFWVFSPIFGNTHISPYHTMQMGTGIVDNFVEKFVNLSASVDAKGEHCELTMPGLELGARPVSLLE